MGYEIRTTSFFDKKLSKKLKKKPDLKLKINKQLDFLREDLKHPSLKLHKLVGRRAEEYSFWIVGNLRITFVIIEDIILLTDLITHDEY